MNDVVVEKLIQKVINMLDEMNDLNIQVRRLTPNQETLNRINERIDAILGSVKQIENGVSNDEKKIAELEKQTQSVETSLSKVNGTMLELKHNTEETRRGTVDIKQDAMAAYRYNESQFQQLKGELEKWFWEHKVWLIVLAATQLVLIIVILLR